MLTRELHGAVGYKGAIHFVLGGQVNEEIVKVILKDQLKWTCKGREINMLH